MRPIARLAGRIALSNFTDLGSPYKITYALTSRCQFRCSMCSIWRQEPAPELTAAEISEFFRRSGGFSWINLSGGEIFLRPDLREIVASIAAHCRGVYLLNFPTNGYLTETIVGTVAEVTASLRLPRLMVTVSLDGPPELHDRIRGVAGSWGRAVETFRLLRRIKTVRFGVYFGMTLQDANADAFEETVSSVREEIGDIRNEDFHVNVLHTSGHYYRNTECGGIRRPQKIREGLGRIRRLRKSPVFSPVAFLERRYQSMAEEYLTTGMNPVGCQALSASFFMDPAGTVYPCTIFDSPIGNVRDYGYALGDLWRSERRLAARREVVKGNCPHCWTPCEAYQSILANVVPGFRT